MRLLTEASMSILFFGCAQFKCPCRILNIKRNYGTRANFKMSWSNKSMSRWSSVITLGSTSDWITKKKSKKVAQARRHIETFSGLPPLHPQQISVEINFIYDKDTTGPSGKLDCSGDRSHWGSRRVRGEAGMDNRLNNTCFQNNIISLEPLPCFFQQMNSAFTFYSLVKS